MIVEVLGPARFRYARPPRTGNCVFSVLGVDQFRLKLESLGRFRRRRGDALDVELHRVVKELT